MHPAVVVGVSATPQQLGHVLPLWSIVPFGLMVLSIAVLPLVAS